MPWTESQVVVAPSTASLVNHALRPMDGLPIEVVGRAVLAITDWIGVAIGGSRHPLAGVIRDTVLADGGTDGRATVIGTGIRTGELLASLINGAQGHALDFDDTHVASVVHVSSPILPAVLAVGETRVATGRQVIEAYVVGVEVAAWVGGAVGEDLADRGFHVTGVLGHLGAAAGAGRLLGLDQTQMEHALGLAATQAAGLVESFGTMAKPFHAGKAAMDGLLAARLAERGFTGPTNGIDGRQGLLATLFQREIRAVWQSEPPSRSAILDVSFKPYASCFGTHAVIDSTLAIHHESAPAPDAIVRVECTVHPLAAKVAAHPRPSCGLEGKFSIQYCAALGLFGAVAGEADFTDHAVRRQDLRQLMSRVMVSPDGSMSMGQASVQVVLADGSVLRKDVVAPSGTPQQPMSTERLRGKFENLVAPTLGEQGARRLLEACAGFAEVPNIDPILALTRP